MREARQLPPIYKDDCYEPLCTLYKHMMKPTPTPTPAQMQPSPQTNPIQSNPIQSKTAYTLRHQPAPSSNIIIIILKVNIPRPTAIRNHEIAVPRRPLVARIRRQHTLDTHADALDRLHGRPPGRAEQVQADNSVAVDVRVDGDWAPGVRGCCCCCCCCGEFDELDLRGL